ncbi:MAG TPA: hypothetical protein P5519_09085 [Spirochaetia bacterium]|nr:hypothetical protein [Spirochaetales bacterium]HRS66027.1 hypothetical protein [Spirochaetia bacterium]HOT58367.1 hypothetical protein [Spirochaetales bacterium]HPD80044.1 hypothetical protein [Spirochaetales bacterium]HQG40003.1 hypothetical protein [Spirochaetales bacterium]
MNYEITRQEHGNDVYFTVRWSPLIKADKHIINTQVPAVAGIVELYFQDTRGKMNLYAIVRSYYGGLRATLRSATDPELEKDERRRTILLLHEDKIFFRYSCIESQDDMTDIIFFFMATYAPDVPAYPNSGRYEKIYLKEIDAEKVISL